MSIKYEIYQNTVIVGLAALAFALAPTTAKAGATEQTIVSAVQTGGQVFRSEGPDIIPFPESNGSGARVFSSNARPENDKYPLWYRRGN
jgi:hypothetical protein